MAVKHFLTAIVVAVIVGIIVYVADDRLSMFPLMLILAVAIYIVSRISASLIKNIPKKIDNNTVPPLKGRFLMNLPFIFN